MRSPEDGAAVFSNKASYLCTWNGIKWQKIIETTFDPNLPFYKTANLLWFAVQDTIPYRRQLLCFDGANISPVHTPQANGIRSIYFTQQNTGWAGCEWGQLLRWDGSDWRLELNFTPYHAKAIFAAGDSSLYAFNDIPAQNYMEVFEYSNKEWRPLQKISTRRFSGNALFLGKELFFIPKNDSLFVLKSDEWQPVDLQAILRDTLILPTTVHPHQLTWASHKGSVRSCNFIHLENQRTCSDDDIVNIVKINNPNEAANAATFYLFSKIGLQRILHIISSRYKPLENSIIFYTAINHVSGSEDGVCVADFTGDGLEDVYAVVGGAANRLYPASVTHYPGRVAENAEAAGVSGGAFTDNEYVDYDHSVSHADIDNDGDQDLFVTSLYGPSVMFRQKRPGRFHDYSRISRLDRDYGRSFLGIWSDVNNDGALDLFVNNSDSASHFYLNNGAGIFRDITHKAGLYGISSSSAAFGDVDNDGDDDLVLSKGGRLCLYKNETRGRTATFRQDVSQPFFVGPDSLSPIASLFLSDLDNDGDLDLFATRIMANDLLFENKNGIFENVTEQAGIINLGYGVETVPIDADNDGDLDILISNKGSIVYYKNLGHLTFCRENVVDEPKSFGGAMAVADFENDGDLDVYTSDGESNSRLLINRTNNNNFIKLTLKGAPSNRDAIGARIDIFCADSSRRYCGMRTINGGQGAMSGSSRIVHIGVADRFPRHLKIRFPSGTIRYINNIAAGRSIVVTEHEGFVWKSYLFKNWIRHYLFYTPFQHDVLFLLSSTLLLLLIQLPLRKFVSWSSQTAFLLLWLPLTVIVVVFFLTHQNYTFLSYLLPVLFGAVSWGLGFVFTQKLEHREKHQLEMEEDLFFKTAAFFHGEWGASKLNRLQFFAVNYNRDTASDIKVQLAFVESINEFFLYILPEIEKILHNAEHIPSLREAYIFTQNNYKKLIDDLNKIKVELQLSKFISEIQLRTLNERVETLKLSLKQIRKNNSEQFSTPVIKIIQSVISKCTVPVSINASCDENVRGRIRPSEFLQILENLFSNAERALSNCVNKKIHIHCSANMDRIFLTFEDNGHGISPDVRNRLFVQQITTKRNGGGFGLFHANKTLAKHGGAIKLKEPQPQSGTAIQLEIKRIHDE